MKEAISPKAEEPIHSDADDEEELFSERARLHCFRDGDWTERGAGDAKLLRHKESGKSRFLMRHETSSKVIANFLVVRLDPYCDLRPSVDSEKCWVWTVLDQSEVKQVVEQFALSFTSSELAAQFAVAFEIAKDYNEEALGDGLAKEAAHYPKPSSSATSAAQDGLQTTAVSGVAQDGQAAAPSAEEEEQYVAEEEVTNIPGWTPSVTLEVHDAVQTGEEGEEEIYCQRSKLFRFREGEWKERGIGNAKLLKHKENGKVRFMLRQEKTLKVVANFYVIEHETYCDLRPHSGSDKFWVWTVPDYSEDEPTVEQFALKFGNPELAAQFAEAFNSAKLTCDKASTTDIAAPTSPRPSAANAPDGGARVAAPVQMTPGLFATTGSNANPASSGSSIFAGLSFGGATSSSFTGFSSLASSASSTFGGSGFAGTTSSSFAGSHTTAGGANGGVAEAGHHVTASNDEDDRHVEEEEVTTIPGWAPTVSLEVQESVPTGEEDEEEIYCQRSKLYRFRDGEWKERGIGNAKLLRNKESGKVRFMLRQEKTFKVFANFNVIQHETYCNLRPNSGSDKCWVWTAPDYSESEQIMEQFALKFGNAELAGQFADAFNNAKRSVEEASSKPAETDAVATSSPSFSATPEVGAASSGSGTSSSGLFAGVAPAGLISGTSGSSSSSPFTGGIGSSSGSSSSPLVGGASSGSGGSSLFSSSASTGTGASLFSGSSSMSSASPWAGGAQSGLFAGSGASQSPSFAGPTSLFSGSSSSSSLFSGASTGSSGSGLFAGNTSSSSLFSGASTGSSGSGLFAGITGSLFSSASSSAAGLSSGAAGSSTSSGSSLFGSSPSFFSGASSSPPPLFASGGLFSQSSGSTSENGKAAGASPAEEEEREAAEQEENEEEEVTNIPGWTPAVTLEVKDTIATGEEDEDEIYSQRSKLYRFRDGEWKERGIGNAKLLKHKESGKVRFMLRQEKTLKVVANFYVLRHETYCDLRPNSGSDKCWVWSVPDLSEDEQIVEQFALKFGNSELATQFQEAFDKAKDCNGSAEVGGETSHREIGKSTATEPQSLGAAGATFASPAQTSSSLFGNVGSFTNSASSGSVSFGGLGSGGASVFAGLGGGTGESAQPQEEEERYEEEEEITNIPGWTPSVTLEVQDTIPTGEENEEELYCQRSKLYRFRDGEWKERGIGNAKLLKHKETGKVRFMLRQEKTLKVVANFYVIQHETYCDLRMQSGSDKLRVWTVPDYSESEQIVEQFALKFGNAELAEQFEDAFNSAKQSSEEVNEAAAATNATPTTSPSLLPAPAPPAASTGSSMSSSGLFAGAAPAGLFAGTSGSSSSSPFIGAAASGLFAGIGSSSGSSTSPLVGGPSSGGLFSGASLFSSASTGTGSSLVSGSASSSLFSSSPSTSTGAGLFSGSNSMSSASPWAGGAQSGLFAGSGASQSSFASPGGLFAGSSGSTSFGSAVTGTASVLFSGGSSSSSSSSLFGGASAGSSGSGLFPGSSSSSSLFTGPSTGSSGSGLFAGITGSLFSSASSSAAGLSSGAAGSSASSGSSLFGSSSSFFSGASSSPSPLFTSGGLFSQSSGSTSENCKAAGASPGEEEEGQAAEQEENEEEEITNIPGWTPSVTLEVKDTIATGEEDEDEIYSQRSKLYRFRDGEWKERGIGNAKLLQHKESGKVRFMLRQEKTLKVVANFYVLRHETYCDLRPNSGSDKCWVWTVPDLSEDEQIVEQFALKFGNSELATQFQEAFERAKDCNAEALGSSLHGETGETTATEPQPLSAGGATFTSPAQTTSSLFGNAGSFNSSASSGSLTFGGLGSSGASAFAGLVGGMAESTQPQEEEERYEEEEEITNIPGWTPSVTLEVQDTIPTGEENEEEMYCQRSKLYRFRDGEWKERGIGNAKLLKHKETGKVRFMLRQEKTLKVVANFYVIQHETYCDLRMQAGSDKLRVWTVPDYSESEQIVEQFALKFGSAELADQFGEAFNAAKQSTEGVSEVAAATNATPTTSPSLSPAPAPSAASAGAGGSSSSSSFAGVAPSGIFSGIRSSSSSSPSPFSGGAPSGLFAGSGGASLFSGASTGSSSAFLFSSASTGAAPGLFSGSGSSSFFGSASSSGTGSGLFTGSSASSSSPLAGGALSGLFSGSGASSSSGVVGSTPIGFFSGASATASSAASAPLFGGGNSNLFSQSSGSSTTSSSSLFAGGAQSCLFSGTSSSSSSSPFTGCAPSSLFSGASSSTSLLLGAANSIFSGSGGSSSSLFAGSSSSSSLFAGSYSSSSLFAGSGSSSALFAGSGSASSGLFSGCASAMSSPFVGIGGCPAGNGQATSPPHGVDEDPLEPEQDENEEEEITTIPGWTPSVTLEVKETIATGEEDEEEIYAQRSKLYRFRDGEWKERGIGKAKLLKHKESGKVRFMLRQEKTFKVVANFYVIQHETYCDLRSNSGSDKCWVWTAPDYSEEEQIVEQFALKFGSSELANQFREAFERAKDSSSEAGGTDAKENLVTAEVAATTSKSLFGFGAAPQGVTFGLPAQTAPSLFTLGPDTAATGTGLVAGFGSSTTDAQPTASPADEDEYVAEEEITNIPGWSPSVSLEVKDTISTGEEDEEAIYEQRAKLFRFREGEWKERGIGVVKLLKHKDDGKVRFMLRQEKTFKVIANFYVVEHDTYCDLRPNAGSDKFWVWTAPDYSEDEQVVEKFALKFGNAELAAQFADAFNKAKQFNNEALGDPVGGNTGPSTDLSAAAGATTMTSSLFGGSAAFSTFSGNSTSSSSSSSSLFTGASTGFSGSGLFAGNTSSSSSSSLFTRASTGSSASGLFAGFSGGSSSSSSSIFASPTAASSSGGLQVPGSGGIRVPETTFAPAAGATAAAADGLASQQQQQQRISHLESQIEELRRELQEVKDRQHAVVVQARDQPNPEINEVKERLALLEELRNEDHAILLRLEESSKNSKASQHSKDVMDRLDKVLECVMEAPRRRQPVVRRPQLSDRLLYMQAIRDVQEESSESESPAVRLSQLPHRPRLGNSRGVPGALLRQIA